MPRYHVDVFPPGRSGSSGPGDDGLVKLAWLVLIIVLLAVCCA